MPSIGAPTTAFSQSKLLKSGDPGVCCRLAYKWLACQAKPGSVKHLGGGTFFSLGLNKTLEKQNAYLAEADPYEKQDALTFRQGVNAVTDKWLNVWGGKHGLGFDALAGPKRCSEYFGKYDDRSAVIGIFGTTATGGNWAHATAYYAGGSANRKFFDANKGEWANLKLSLADLGAALDTFHEYLKSPGETLDRYSFFVLL
jgi:hypothetical protein